MLDSVKTYNAAWANLNASLKASEAVDGLVGAIATLEENQR